MKQNITEKRIAGFLIIVFILALIPVLYIGKYNYPCADDFGFSAYSHIAWEETHSILQVVIGALTTVKERWFGWQGTFSSIFVMALQPAVFGEAGYRLVPWIMIGAMSFSTLFLLYIIVRRVMGVRTSVYLGISMIYLIFALECMVDKTQGFFWFNGAAHYIIPHSVALILTGLVIWLIKNEKHKFYKMVLACIAAFFVGGGNYISALVTAILFVSASIVAIYTRKKEYVKLILLPFIFFFIAFLTNICAPGNAVRQGEVGYRPGVVKSIMLSFYYCVEYITETWFDWTYIIFILILIPFLWELVKTIGNKFNYRFPILVPIGSFCLLSAMFTPSLYAMGEAGGGRIFNIIFLDYLLLIILNIFYILGWVYRHCGLGKSKESCIESRNIKLYLLALLCLTIFIGGLYSRVDPNYFTSTSAVKSLISGEAADYGEETRKRTNRLQNNDQQSIQLEILKTKPYLLYYSDIGVDADDWKNNSMERYYRIKEIWGIY
ncbi:hypothetical protein SAMN05216405_3989 [Lachnospiraceae bacterium NLAE-zl-G231]|nr:hypothetical protein SAMN05216405_3989 [Lachnospiraceae bacterium NLAE-zl-G231]